MKPIVVVDRDAFDDDDPYHQIRSEATNMELNARMRLSNTECVKEGYIVVPVKVGARVQVFHAPIPDVGKDVHAVQARQPILVFDADSGIEGETRRRLEDAGYMTLMVMPNSRVVLL